MGCSVSFFSFLYTTQLFLFTGYLISTCEQRGEREEGLPLVTIRTKFLESVYFLNLITIMRHEYKNNYIIYLFCYFKKISHRNFF